METSSTLQHPQSSNMPRNLLPHPYKRTLGPNPERHSYQSRPQLVSAQPAEPAPRHSSIIRTTSAQYHGPRKPTTSHIPNRQRQPTLGLRYHALIRHRHAIRLRVLYRGRRKSRQWRHSAHLTATNFSRHSKRDPKPFHGNKTPTFSQDCNRIRREEQPETGLENPHDSKM